jgi:hypothetical protein
MPMPFITLVVTCSCAGATAGLPSAPATMSASDEKRLDLLLVEDSPHPMPGQPPSMSSRSIDTVRADGSSRTVLTTNAGTPNWTPDGRVIFISDRSGSNQIWIMNADGSDPRQIGNLSASMLPVMPQLASNGLVAFMGMDANAQPDDNVGIWTMRDDGSELTELTTGMQPSLAPSGTWIAYTFQTDSPYHREIWRIDTDGSNKRQLTFLGDPDYPDANAPNISPDEGTVAFFSGKESDRAVSGAPMQSVFDFGHRNVAIVPAQGGDRKTLTPCHPVTTQQELDATSDVTGDCVAADNPAWSPDGGWLVFDVGFASGVETWMVDVNGKGFQSFYPHTRGTVRFALEQR